MTTIDATKYRLGAALCSYYVHVHVAAFQPKVKKIPWFAVRQGASTRATRAVAARTQRRTHPRRAWSRRVLSPRGTEPGGALGVPPPASPPRLLVAVPASPRARERDRLRTSTPRAPAARTSLRRRVRRAPRWRLPNSVSRTRSSGASATRRGARRPRDRRLGCGPPRARASANRRTTNVRRGPPRHRATRPDAFVRVSGTRFVVGCPPPSTRWWAGTRTRSWNRRRASTMGSFGADFSRHGREQVLEMLDRAAASGFNTVRTWAYSVGERQPMQTHPGCTTSPRSRAWTGCCTKPKRGGAVVLVLTRSRREHHGGVSQYLDWAAARARRGRVSGSLRGLEVRVLLRPAPAGACTRRTRRRSSSASTRAGVSYRDDPTIFAWSSSTSRGAADAARACRRGSRDGEVRQAPGPEPHAVYRRGLLRGRRAGQRARQPRGLGVHHRAGLHRQPRRARATSPWRTCGRTTGACSRWAARSARRSPRSGSARHTRDATRVLRKPFALEEFRGQRRPRAGSRRDETAPRCAKRFFVSFVLSTGRVSSRNAKTPPDSTPPPPPPSSRRIIATCSRWWSARTTPTARSGARCSGRGTTTT